MGKIKNLISKIVVNKKDVESFKTNELRDMGQGNTKASKKTKKGKKK